MRSFSQIPVQLRIILMVSAAIIGFTGFTIYSFMTAVENRNRMESVVSTYFPVLERVDANLVRLNKIQELFIQAVSAAEEDLLGEAQAVYDKSIEIFDEISGIDPSLTETITDLIHGMNQYFDQGSQISRGILSGETEPDEMAANVEKMSAELLQFQNRLKRFRQDSYLHFTDTVARANHTAEQMTYFGMVVGLINLAFIGILTYFIQNNLKMMRIIQEQNEHLEQKVWERTSQLRAKTNDILSILENIPEGVLTVLEDFTIHPEYSKHLEDILGTNDISGKNIIDLVFHDIGSDARSGLDASLGSILGQDVIFFEANNHYLANEIEFKAFDGRNKTLELSWAPICSEEETVEKLLISIRDVTELRQLQESAREHKRELEIIGQILAVSAEKFSEFVKSAYEFLEGNEKIIQANYHDKNVDVLSELFRNMHTIKGNARTYGFLHLTNTVHEAEEKYNHLRNNPDAEWQPDVLLADLKLVGTLIEEYDTVNSKKLGRKGPGRIGDDKFLLVEKGRVGSALNYLSEIENLNVQQLKDHILVARCFLQSIGSESLREILSGVLDSANKMAVELGKPEPVITIEDQNIYIKNPVYGLMRNAFGHIIRNSLDHGLELPEERLNKGKPAQGNILVKLTTENRQLRIVYTDDGRGLNVGKIRKKAMKNQLIHDTDQLSDYDIAQLIFSSGLSTAEQVTEISGRGVGMDAVKKFFEKEKGSVEVELLPPTPAHGQGFYPFQIVMSLPSSFAIEMPSIGLTQE
ncbi:MAG: Hpt domain-containing protein [SAR324 cluster bacterium]|nr:Hpt domain-containing protein [SAR324 cluster bacterium]